MDKPHLKKITVAIDGPAGAGKSTVARSVAKALNYMYVDTGAMYRAAAFVIRRENVNPGNHHDVSYMTESLDIRLEPGVDDAFTTRVFVGDEELTEEIRTTEIGNLASTISTVLGVRKYLVQLQRQMGRGGGVVMEGRDIDTVVFPAAELKVFLTASPETRAKRRQLELAARGVDAAFKQLLKETIERDTRDAGRDVAPMKPAEDARILNSDRLTEDEVTAKILEWHKEIVG